MTLKLLSHWVVGRYILRHTAFGFGGSLCSTMLLHHKIHVHGDKVTKHGPCRTTTTPLEIQQTWKKAVAVKLHMMKRLCPWWRAVLSELAWISVSEGS